MKALRALFEEKNKKAFQYLVAVFIVGILLLIVSNSFTVKPDDIKVIDLADPSEQAAVESGYESGLERRMEDALSRVEGVGNVKVMITLAYGRETIVGADNVTSNSSSKESDAGGGSRETISNSNEDKTIIITGKNGESKPLVLKEVEPKVEGVIIVAEGGDDIYVKDALTRAAATILGLELNKVQILKMKSIKGG